jgi:hypothetical protein
LVHRELHFTAMGRLVNTPVWSKVYQHTIYAPNGHRLAILIFDCHQSTPDAPA